MLYLRPQRVYKPSALSYLGDPSDIVDSIIDRYLNKDLYRLRIEIPRGTSITADNSQITCYAHIFDKEDGTELTDLLKGRGYRPTWLLDGKPIDSARISEEGYLLTLETTHLPAIYQTVTLQVRDTDILLALTTDENQKRIYSQLIELGSIPTHLIKTSEKLLNVSRLDKIRVEGLEEIKQDLAKALASKQPAGSYALTSELATSAQQTLAEAVKQAGEMDKQIKVGGRNLIVTSRWKAGYLYGDLGGKNIGEEYYKVIARYGSFRFDPVYIPTLGESKVTYKLYDNGGRTDSNVQIHAYDKDKKFLWWSFDDWKGEVGRTVTWTLPADTAYIRLGVVNENVRAKVEFGTVATDWTPAPEDVSESVSKVNTSLTALASTLLDPTTGEIHKLTSQLESHGKTLGSQAEALSEQSQRLTTAEEALTGKLDSGEFSKWQAGDLAKLLAGKQNKGNYVVPSELATSQQQTLAEAVKRAGEMDKQLKVGGRNLIRAGFGKAFRLSGDYREAREWDATAKKLTVTKAERWNSWIFLEWLASQITIDISKDFGLFTISFSVRGRGRFEIGVTPDIPNYDNADIREVRMTEEWQRVSLTFDNQNKGLALFSVNPVNKEYIVGDWVQFADDWKLERGTVATDWTPAPEDVYESVSKVNTSLTSLASTLLDPTTGEIHKLTTQLESHKKSTDKNFDDLATHPLTVDDNGYWRVWSVKDNQYVTTQYKSRGEDGQDAGRYLGKAKRIHTDFNGNYLLETENSWRTAKEGDYVYLVGDLSNRGGDKDTYYIVRERKSSTVWEEYNIKGRTPDVYLGSDYYLYVNGVKQQYLKGDPGDKGADGHTPVLSLDRQYRLLADNKLVSQDSLKGEPGHSPSPEEVVDTPTFADKLKAEIEGSETYKVTVTTRGEIRNAKVYDGVTVNNTPAIQHTAHIYSLFGIDKSTTLGDKLTWTINKGRTGSTTQPQERTVTGLICNVYDSDLVYNGVGARYYDIELESQFKPSSTTLEHKAHVTSQDTTESKNLLQDGLSPKSLVNGCFQYSLYATTYDREGTFTFSFDASRVKRPPKGGQFLIKLFPGSRYEKLEYIPFKFGKRRYSVTTVIVEKTTGTGKSPDFIEVYPNSKEEYSKDPDSGDLVVDFVKLERGAVATEWTPAPEDILRDISNANEEISKRARTTHLDNALNYMYNLHAQLEETPFITVSKGGNLSVRGLAQYCPIKPGIDPDETVTVRKCVNGVKEQSVDLVLRSDYDTLKAQVQNLAVKVAQLEASNVINPDSSRGGQSTIYPKYGDWILTSDTLEQTITFAGLNAEIGRSIYIQTRKKAYLSANRHSFYGLPGNPNSIKVDQTLAANTTYRFVRASSDSWFVTASSSPYPWT